MIINYNITSLMMINNNDDPLVNLNNSYYNKIIDN